MRNNTTVDFDGVCIYIKSKVGAALTGKIILAGMNLVCWGGFIAISVNIPREEFKSFIIALLLISFILVFFVGRFTAWNFWGSEFIRINIKSLSYSRSYGIVESNEKVIETKNLSAEYIKVRTIDEIEYGKIIFWDYNELNNPVEIFETTVLIPIETVDNVFGLLDELYKLKIADKYEVPPVSLN